MERAFFMLRLGVLRREFVMPPTGAQADSTAFLK